MAWRTISTILLLMCIAHVRTQFFDLFGVQPTKLQYGVTTKRPIRIDNIKTVTNQDGKMRWKNTSISFFYDEIEKDDRKEKKRKEVVVVSPPIFGFDFIGTTKPVRKPSKSTNQRPSSPITESRRHVKYPLEIVDINLSNNNRLSYYKPDHEPDGFNIELATKPKRYNDHTTKDPYFDRGVKPAVIDNGPPITNRPVTKRPFGPDTRPYEGPNVRPQVVTARPNAVTNRPTNKVTQRPYEVRPVPTDPGSISYPSEDDSPEIWKGRDEDYMSEAEKRRFIELSERMCDKYKSMNTEQLQAIPLLPSPEPVQVNISKCTPSTIPLVVGGKVVSINEFPHMVLLGWQKVTEGGYSWKCGGSLISERYVLTAAHCSYQERDNTVVTGPPRVVQLGSSYLDDPGALVVRVAAVIRHPKYKFPKSYYDLALLKLAQPVTFSEVIRPACLGVPPAVHEPIIATGWGKTEFPGDQSLELRSVSLPIWEMGQCRDILGTSRKMPQGPSEESQMCAGETRGGKDTCQGDSGGPAQIQDGCVWRVVAVTSLGRSCGAANTPGLYALAQRVFIAAQVFDESSNNNYNQNGNRQQNHNQPDNNYKNNGNNQQQNTRPTSKPFKNSKTTTESYFNHKQNDDSNGYHKQTTNYQITTTTEPYYNVGDPYVNNNNFNQNDYSYQNGNRQQNERRKTTTTTKDPYSNIYYRPGDYNRPARENQNSKSYPNTNEQSYDRNNNERHVNHNQNSRSNDDHIQNDNNYNQNSNYDYQNGDSYYHSQSGHNTRRSGYEEGKVVWT